MPHCQQAVVARRSEVVMGDVERGASHGEVAKQSHVRGVRYRLGPRESRPRRWIGGGCMHLLGEITPDR